MFEKQVKKVKMLDFTLSKLGVATFVLFLISIWPAAQNWALSVNPWYFLAVSLISVAIVQYRVWK